MIDRLTWMILSIYWFILLIDCSVDWFADQLVDWLIDLLTDGLIDWLNDSLDSLTYSSVDWLFRRLTHWPVAWLTGRSVDWLNDSWLIRWLVDQLICSPIDRLIIWLIDCSVDRLVDWLGEDRMDWQIDWMKARSIWALSLTTCFCQGSKRTSTIRYREKWKRQSIRNGQKADTKVTTFTPNTIINHFL